jgi:D-glycero-alpha-D-manno-heptose-7-phosphate kinase
MPKRRSATRSIVARGCCRVDLAGGTLDMWPLYLFHPGAVTVNMGVSVMTECRIDSTSSPSITLRSRDTNKEDRFANVSSLLKAKRFNHALAGYLCRFFLQDAALKSGFTLETHSESPAGAGISGSSALMISTTAALARLTGRKLDKEKIREIAQNVEAQLIQVPTGCQDYYPALYGGVNAIHLREDGIHCEELPVDHAEINSRFVLVYTGAPRQSGINNWEVFKSHINGDKRVFSNFTQIGQIAQEMERAVRSASWTEVARLLREEWKLRKTNAPGITTPLIEKLVSSAMKQGARAAKVCGAGGGGCVIFFVEPDAQGRVKRAIEQQGGQVLPFKVHARGVSVTEQA